MAQTAAQHVLRIRELAQVVSSVAISFTNGFSGDAAPPTNVVPTRVLPALNEYLARLSSFNALYDTLDVVLASGTAEYALATNTVNVTSVRIGVNALTHASRDGLDETDSNWQGESGTPTKYIEEGLKLTLSPTPNAIVTAKVRRSILLGPLVATGDTIASISGPIPDDIDLLIPYGAVIAMLGIDADDIANDKRLKVYMQYAMGLEQRLMQLAEKSGQDFSTQISADNFIPQTGGRNMRLGRITPIGGKPQGAGNGTNG